LSFPGSNSGPLSLGAEAVMPFVGTTQMKFDVTFTDVSGKLNAREQITATIRGESESTNVADHVAKSLAKHYVAVLKNADKSNSAKNAANPAS